MSHHVHPYAHRLGILRDWKSRWFADRGQYQEYLKGDTMLRGFLEKRLLPACAVRSGHASGPRWQAMRRATCRPGASSLAAKSCTTTTTPTRLRRSFRSSPTSSISAGSISAAWKCSAWPKYARRRPSWLWAPFAWPTARPSRP